MRFKLTGPMFYGIRCILKFKLILFTMIYDMKYALQLTHINKCAFSKFGLIFAAGDGFLYSIMKLKALCLDLPRIFHLSYLWMQKIKWFPLASLFPLHGSKFLKKTYHKAYFKKQILISLSNVNRECSENFNFKSQKLRLKMPKKSKIWIIHWLNFHSIFLEIDLNPKFDVSKYTSENLFNTMFEK